MELKTLQVFNELARDIDNSKVGSYIKLLREELTFYNKALERATLLENSYDIAAARSRIETLTKKLNEPIRINGVQIEGIDETPLIPLAQSVWDEGEAYLHKLRSDLQTAWGIASQAKEKYLNKIQEIGRLRQESEKVAAQMNNCCLTLRKNPMKMIQVGRLDPFIVDYNTVDKLTR